MNKNSNFDLILKWQDGCIKWLRILLKQGFYFSKSKNLEVALNNQIPLTDEIRDLLVVKYYNTISRIPVCIPRIIFECKDLFCPENLRQGYEALKTALKSGGDLLPRMSRRAMDLDCCDGMLNDWDIQHFHLGVIQDVKHPNLIQGTSDVAYVYMTRNVAYIITIAKHGEWANQKLLETLLRDYPHALDDWKTPYCDISYELDAQQRTEMRKCHLNSMIKINGTVYMNPHGGEMSDGSNSIAIHKMLRMRKMLRFLCSTVHDVLLNYVRWDESDIDNSQFISFSGNEYKWQIVIEKANCSEGAIITQDKVSLYSRVEK